MKKTVLSIVAMVVILGMCALGAYRASQDYAEQYNDVRKLNSEEGETFGKEKTEQACVVKAFEQYKACELSASDLCETQKRSFLIACLKHSKRDGGMCENTPTTVSGGKLSGRPAAIDRQEALFKKTLCAKLPEYPEECERFAESVMSYCKIRIRGQFR